MSTEAIVPDTKPCDYPHAITPHIWWVGCSAWGSVPQLSSPYDCNIYLLKGDKFDVLVDCGGGPTKKLEENIRFAGSSPSRIREIWLTHVHCDHFVGAGLWAKRHPATICRISKISIDFLQKKNYRILGHWHPPRPANFHVPEHLLPLDGKSTLSCPPWKFTVEETPGHAPDCLVFRGKVDGQRAIFSGDTVLGDQEFNGMKKGLFGWLDGYWLSDVRHLHGSLTSLAKKPTDLIMPGHGRPHAGKAAAASLKNCVGRITRLMASPDFANIGPFYMK
jgi:glyoxylase-like metal-dependent hydrolase (beta-lactamase superfamily II)